MVSRKDSTHEVEKARGGDLPAASGPPSPAASGRPLPAPSGTSMPAPSGAPLLDASGAPLPAADRNRLLDAHDEELPLIIKLCLGEVFEVAASRREAIFRRMGCDPDLNIVASVGVVLGGEIELHLRFRRYRSYQFALCKLCARRFRETYVEAIKAFLACEATDLDRGFSLPLQQLAIRRSCA